MFLTVLSKVRKNILFSYTLCLNKNEKMPEGKKCSRTECGIKKKCTFTPLKKPGSKQVDRLMEKKLGQDSRIKE